MRNLLARWRRVRHRLRLACAVAIDRIDRNAGLELLCLSEQATGVYAIETITLECMMDSIIDRFGEHPRFAAIAEEAIQRVASKWDSDGHLSSAAYDWAERLFTEYAASEGITLHDYYA